MEERYGNDASADAEESAQCSHRRPDDPCPGNARRSSNDVTIGCMANESDALPNTNKKEHQRKCFSKRTLVKSCREECCECGGGRAPHDGAKRERSVRSARSKMTTRTRSADGDRGEQGRALIRMLVGSKKNRQERNDDQSAADSKESRPSTTDESDRDEHHADEPISGGGWIERQHAVEGYKKPL